MKYQHMIDMLFVLLAKRRISAGELAARYNISVRTVYRYIDEMTVAGIPIDVARGAGGGIYISDTYKLPKGYMTREEYESAINAMQAMESELGDPALSSAISKLSAKAKEERQDGAITGNILVDSGTWGNERKFSEKLTLLERAIAEKEALEIDYIARDGERTRRIVLPHLLVYKQNIWYVYAYCRLRGAFRLFKVGPDDQRIPLQVAFLPSFVPGKGAMTDELAPKVEAAVGSAVAKARAFDQAYYEKGYHRVPLKKKIDL